MCVYVFTCFFNTIVTCIMYVCCVGLSFTWPPPTIKNNTYRWTKCIGVLELLRQKERKKNKCFGVVL